MFHTLIKQGFLTNQSAQGPIYILILDMPLTRTYIDHKASRCRGKVVKTYIISSCKKQICKKVYQVSKI